MTAMQDRPGALLARLEDGFSSHARHLQTLSHDLERAVQGIRRLAQARHPSHEWQTHWQALEHILQQIKDMAQAIEDAIDSGEDEKLKQALIARHDLRSTDQRLADELRLVRDHLHADATAQAEWNALASAVESELNSIHSCVMVIRTKLELAEGRTPEQVRDFVRDVVEDLRRHPCPEGVDPATYELEYLKASIELAHERHQELGFPTVIKTLFTWVETPEERVQRNLAFAVD